MKRNKNIVFEKYPDAIALKYKTQGFKARQYYLIWSTFKTMDRRRLGEGNTEAQAWKDAADWVKAKPCNV